MWSGKGQGSLTDVLILALLTSILLVFFGTNVYTEQERSQGLRYRSALTQRSLMSVVKYVVPEQRNKTLGEVMGHFLCTVDRDLNYTIQSNCTELLGHFLENYNYILFAEYKKSAGEGNEIRVYNKQGSVCLENLVLASFNMSLPCTDYVGKKHTILYLGIWPSWMELPTKCT